MEDSWNDLGWENATFDALAGFNDSELPPVDDSTTDVYIPTPDGWKCERENCHADYLHKHTTYPSLATQPNDGTPARPPTT